MFVIESNGTEFYYKGEKSENIEDLIPEEMKNKKIKVHVIVGGIDEFLVDYEKGIFNCKDYKNSNLYDLISEMIYDKEGEKEIKKEYEREMRRELER